MSTTDFQFKYSHARKQNAKFCKKRKKLGDLPLILYLQISMAVMTI